MPCNDLKRFVTLNLINVFENYSLTSNALHLKQDKLFFWHLLATCKKVEVHVIN